MVVMPSENTNIQKSRACTRKWALIVENAIADADSNAQMIGRQRTVFRVEQPRNEIGRVDRSAEHGIEGQF